MKSAGENLLKQLSKDADRGVKEAIFLLEAINKYTSNIDKQIHVLLVMEEIFHKGLGNIGTREVYISEKISKIAKKWEVEDLFQSLQLFTLIMDLFEEWYSKSFN